VAVVAEEVCARGRTDASVLNTIAAKLFDARLEKIRVNSVHPGLVVSELDRDTAWPLNVLGPWLRKMIARSTHDGAIAQVTVATHPKLKGVGGRYFEDRCINSLCQSCLFCDSANPPGVVPNAQALDASIAKFVEEETEKILAAVR
jgi:hypothetical protein